MVVRQWLNASLVVSALAGLLLFGFGGAALGYSTRWVQSAFGWLLLAAALACLGYGTLSFRCRVVSDGQDVRVVGRLRTLRSTWLDVQAVEVCRSRLYRAGAQLVMANGRRVPLPGIVETEIDDFVPQQAFDRCIERLLEARDGAWRQAGREVAPRPFRAWRWSRYGWVGCEAETAPELVLMGAGALQVQFVEVLRRERIDGRRCTVLNLVHRSGRRELLAVDLPRAVRDIERACQPPQTQQPDAT